MATDIGSVIVKAVADTSAIPKQLSAAFRKFENGSRATSSFKINLDTSSFDKARSKLQLPLGQMSKDASEFAKSMDAATARVFSFTAATAMLYGFGAALKGIVSTGIEVEQQLAQIKVVLGATTKEFSNFTNQLFNISRDTATSFDKISEAAAEFSRQGLSVEETAKRTKDAMVLVKLTGMDAAKAVESLTAVYNTFSDQVSSTADIVDRIVKVDQNFAVSTTDLIEALSRVGATAESAKVPLNDLLGVVAAMQQRTARGGAVIGNALKSIFTRLPTGNTLNALEDFGVAVRDIEGDVRPALDVLTDLADKMKTASDVQGTQIAKMVAGVYQVNQLRALLSELGSEYSNVSKAAQLAADAHGSALQKIEGLLDTTQSSIDRTKTNLTEISSLIGKNLSNKVISSGTGIVNPMLEDFSNLLKKVDDPEKEGQTLGSKFADGIFQGLGAAISGPGFITISALFFGIARQLGGNLLRSLQSLMKIETSQDRQLKLNEALNNILQAGNQYYADRIAKATTLAAKEEAILTAMKNAEITRSTMLPGVIDMYQRGMYVNDAGELKSGGAVRRAISSRGRYAEGYLPKALREELNDIQTSGNYAGNRDAQPVILPNFSVNGVKQTVIANSAEKLVPTKSLIPNYGGPDKLSILNPKQQKAFGITSGKFLRFAFGSLEKEKIFAALESRNLKEAYNLLNKRTLAEVNELFTGSQGRKVRGTIARKRSKKRRIIYKYISQNAPKSTRDTFNRSLFSPAVIPQSSFDSSASFTGNPFTHIESAIRGKSMSMGDFEDMMGGGKTAAKNDNADLLKSIDEINARFAKRFPKKTQPIPPSISESLNRRLTVIERDFSKSFFKRVAGNVEAVLEKQVHGVRRFQNLSAEDRLMVQQSAQRMRSAQQSTRFNSLLGASFVAPMVAGQIRGFGGDSPTASMSASILEGASTGLSTGLMMGMFNPALTIPIAAAGTIAGTISGISSGQKQIKEGKIAKRIKEAQDRAAKESANIETFDQMVGLESQLREAISSGDSPARIRDLQKQIQARKTLITNPELVSAFDRARLSQKPEDFISSAGETSTEFKAKEARRVNLDVLATSDIDKAFGKGSFALLGQRSMFRQDVGIGNFSGLSLWETQGKVSKKDREDFQNALVARLGSAENLSTKDLRGFNQIMNEVVRKSSQSTGDSITSKSWISQIQKNRQHLPGIAQLADVAQGTFVTSRGTHMSESTLNQMLAPLKGVDDELRKTLKKQFKELGNAGDTGQIELNDAVLELFNTLANSIDQVADNVDNKKLDEAYNKLQIKTAVNLKTINRLIDTANMNTAREGSEAVSRESARISNLKIRSSIYDSSMSERNLAQRDYMFSQNEAVVGVQGDLAKLRTSGVDALSKVNFTSDPTFGAQLRAKMSDIVDPAEFLDELRESIEQAEKDNRASDITNEMKSIYNSMANSIKEMLTNSEITLDSLKTQYQTNMDQIRMAERSRSMGGVMGPLNTTISRDITSGFVGAYAGRYASQQAIRNFSRTNTSREQRQAFARSQGVSGLQDFLGFYQNAKDSGMFTQDQLTKMMEGNRDRIEKGYQDFYMGNLIDQGRNVVSSDLSFLKDFSPAMSSKLDKLVSGGKFDEAADLLSTYSTTDRGRSETIKGSVEALRMLGESSKDTQAQAAQKTNELLTPISNPLQELVNPVIAIANALKTRDLTESSSRAGQLVETTNIAQRGVSVVNDFRVLSNLSDEIAKYQKIARGSNSTNEQVEDAKKHITNLNKEFGEVTKKIETQIPQIPNRALSEQAKKSLDEFTKTGSKDKFDEFADLLNKILEKRNKDDEEIAKGNKPKDGTASTDTSSAPPSTNVASFTINVTDPNSPLVAGIVDTVTRLGFTVNGIKNEIGYSEPPSSLTMPA